MVSPMLDAVYMDTVEEKSMIAIRSKPAFMLMFELAQTRQGSNMVSVLEKALPPVDDSEAATSPCLWWRRGRIGCSLFVFNVGGRLTR